MTYGRVNTNADSFSAQQYAEAINELADAIAVPAGARTQEEAAAGLAGQYAPITAVQSAAPGSADDGAFWIDSDDATLYGRISGVWAEVGGAAGFHLSGSGAPNGSITGSVGDRYVDTAATLGARVWYKASGTATNTGWLVAEGDTGLRDISGLLVNGWTATFLHIKRVNNWVWLIGRLDASAASATTALTVPSNFTSHTSGHSPISLLDTSNGNYLNGYLNLGSLLRVRNGAATPTIANMMITGLWETPTAWPSTLPGTAV